MRNARPDATAPCSKRDKGHGEKVELDEEDGKPAVSLFSVVDHASNKAAWVALWPLTGRTHQLRAHMALIETPHPGRRRQIWRTRRRPYLPATAMSARGCICMRGG